MGRFTEEELARMAPGRSPEELASLDMTDGEFEKHGAELRAAHAETRHELDMLKTQGVHEINNLRFEPEVIEHAKLVQARHRDAGYKFDDIVEGIIAPAREEFLAKFGTRPPAARHRIGLNEAAFNKLLGEVQ